jgi:hypothetical protein
MLLLHRVNLVGASRVKDFQFSFEIEIRHACLIHNLSMT